MQESIADELVARLKRRLAHAAPRRPARQEHRHRRDQLPRAARAHPPPRGRRRRRGRRALDRRLRPARPRATGSPPTVFTDVSQAHRIAREEIFGPVLSVLTFRTPDEAVEKANNTPYGLSAGIWTEKGSRILKMAERSCGPASCGPTRSTSSTRRSPFGGYKESGFGREGGRHGLAAYLDVVVSGADMARGSRSARPTSSTSAARSRARRAAARYEVTDAKGRFLANAALASRKDARDAVVAARKAQPRLGGRDGVQPRPGALPRRRDDGGPPRAVRRGGRARRGAHRAAGRGRRRRRDRPLGLVRRLDRQARAGPRRRQPGRGPVLQLLGARADRRRRRRRAAGVVAARPRVGASRR